MFTMAKIKDGGTYLERHLAANDYYCENESVVGKWVGEGARRLGLDQDIRAGDKSFESLRNNRVPDGTEKLTPRDSSNRVKFFDFQCSAQKSVSVMAVTLGDTRLLEAHDAAAKLAFAELEKFAARQASTALTRINIPTGNVVAASFRHTASRALDPQVHTHFVTANATWDERVRDWRALTEFEMVSAIRYAGKVYQNEMARSCRALGYEITESRDNRGTVTGFEIRGVPAEVCRRFSKRRAQIELGIAKFIESHGREPASGEIHAIAVSSRDRKLAARRIISRLILPWRPQSMMCGRAWAIERQRMLLSRQPLKHRLRFPDLTFGQMGMDGLIARVDLMRLYLQSRLFGCGLFASLEVPANPNGTQKARHSPRRGTVPVTEPANGEFCFHE